MYIKLLLWDEYQHEVIKINGIQVFELKTSKIILKHTFVF